MVLFSNYLNIALIATISCTLIGMERELIIGSDPDLVELLLPERVITSMPKSPNDFQGEIEVLMVDMLGRVLALREGFYKHPEHMVLQEQERFVTAIAQAYRTVPVLNNECDQRAFLFAFRNALSFNDIPQRRELLLAEQIRDSMLQEFGLPGLDQECSAPVKKRKLCLDDSAAFSMSELSAFKAMASRATSTLTTFPSGK